MYMPGSANIYIEFIWQNHGQRCASAELSKPERYVQFLFSKVRKPLKPADWSVCPDLRNAAVWDQTGFGVFAGARTKNSMGLQKVALLKKSFLGIELAGLYSFWGNLTVFTKCNWWSRKLKRSYEKREWSEALRQEVDEDVTWNLTVKVLRLYFALVDVSILTTTENWWRGVLKTGLSDQKRNRLKVKQELHQNWRTTFIIVIIFFDKL